MRNPRTTALLNGTGDPRFIGGGANTQDGPLKLYTCNTCSREVVWATSVRTGRVYLVDVFHGASGSRFYVKSSVHQCVRPEDTQARQALEAKLAETAALRAENAADPTLPAALLAKLTAALDRTEQQLREQLAQLPEAPS